MTGRDELARRLCCAWISYHLGLTYQRCLKAYIGDERVGEYWYQLAETIAREAPDNGDSPDNCG